MQRKYILISVLIFLNTAVLKADDKMVPLSVEWDDAVLAQGEGTVKTIKEIISAALGIVEAFPPKGNNLFSWTGPRKTLEGKSLILYLGRTTSPFVKRIFASPHDPSSTVERFDGDSLTAVMTLKPGEVVIATVLLLDRLLFTPSITKPHGAVIGGPLKERPDGLVRVLVALAYELYGNVQADLELPFKNGLPEEPVNLNRRELRSFRASVDFISRFQSSPSFQKLSAKLKSDISEAKKREEKAVSHYSTLVCKEALN